MKREVIRATAWALLATIALVVLILVGSRNLAHFDAILVGYAFAAIFAFFGIVYRYVIWLQRPPTAVYWKRGWQVFFRRGEFLRNLYRWPKHVVNDIALNRFILARGLERWTAHWFIMWGCIIAGLITFPLVFGWLYFEGSPGRPDWYRTVIFGWSVFSFPTYKLSALLIFHGLVWASFMVIAGVMLAMRRRMREAGAQAVQQVYQDFLPLIILFAISITGLMLTASYTWLRGYAYPFLAILHAVTVIFGLLWLPFGKFFHIFQRPAQIGVRFYKEVGERSEPARCRRCDHPFTSRMKVADLIETERRLGYRYEVPERGVEHYQWICPPCRRALHALAQGRLWNGSRGVASLPQPMPRFANPGPGEGPLGAEDARNYHP